MKKNKDSTVMDVVDRLWDLLEDYCKLPVEQIEDMKTTYGELVEQACPAGWDDFLKKIALTRFRYELRFFIFKPVRTMRWLWGEHANLYDVYACKEHRFLVTTHDDDRFREEMTLLCPECNKGKFKEGMMQEYIRDTEGDFSSPEIWEQQLKIAKWFREYRRRENLRYFFKKWTEIGYLKYRILKLFGKYKRAE